MYISVKVLIQKQTDMIVCCKNLTDFCAWPKAQHPAKMFLKNTVCKVYIVNEFYDLF